MGKPTAKKKKRKKPVLRKKPILRKSRGKKTIRKLLVELETNPRKAQKLTKREFELLQRKIADDSAQAKAKKLGKEVKQKFRPTKRQRGKFLQLNKDGKPVTTDRQKGFLVYVTKTGKVQQIQQPGKRGYLAVKKKDVELPHRSNLKKAATQFRKRVMVGKGKAKQPQLRGKVQKGKLTPTLPNGEKQKVNGRLRGKWGSDFNEGAVKKLAKSIRDAVKMQRSKRSYVIAVYAIVETEDGGEKVLYFEVTINTADWRAIKQGGFENFIRLTFYAVLAKELAIHGLVSSGSDNHIRRLRENAGAETDELTKDGMPWGGRDKDIVLIKQLEWQIQQA